MKSGGYLFSVNQAGTGSVYVEVKSPTGKTLRFRFGDHAQPSYKDVRLVNNRKVDFRVDPTTGLTVEDAINFVKNEIPPVRVA